MATAAEVAATAGAMVPPPAAPTASVMSGAAAGGSRRPAGAARWAEMAGDAKGKGRGVRATVNARWDVGRAQRGGGEMAAGGKGRGGCPAGGAGSQRLHGRGTSEVEEQRGASHWARVIVPPKDRTRQVAPGT